MELQMNADRHTWIADSGSCLQRDVLLV